MAIDDPLDAAEDRIAAGRRSDPALAPYVPYLADIASALPSWVGLPASIVKTVLDGRENERRDFLVQVVVKELRRVRDQVARVEADHAKFLKGEYLDLLLNALQRAERTRAKSRIERMGKVLGASAKIGPSLPADEVEEMLRISMDLDDADTRVLGALVDGQRDLLVEPTGMVPPGPANKYWQRASAVSDSTGRTQLADQAGVSDGALHSACAKLQAYGLLVQIERDESKLKRGAILYAILPRAVTFIDALRIFPD